MTRAAVLGGGNDEKPRRRRRDEGGNVPVPSNQQSSAPSTNADEEEETTCDEEGSGADCGGGSSSSSRRAGGQEENGEDRSTGPATAANPGGDDECSTAPEPIQSQPGNNDSNCVRIPPRMEDVTVSSDDEDENPLLEGEEPSPSSLPMSNRPSAGGSSSGENRSATADAEEETATRKGVSWDAGVAGNGEGGRIDARSGPENADTGQMPTDNCSWKIGLNSFRAATPGDNDHSVAPPEPAHSSQPRSDSKFVRIVPRMEDATTVSDGGDGGGDGDSANNHSAAAAAAAPPGRSGGSAGATALVAGGDSAMAAGETSSAASSRRPRPGAVRVEGPYAPGAAAVIAPRHGDEDDDAAASSEEANHQHQQQQQEQQQIEAHVVDPEELEAMAREILRTMPMAEAEVLSVAAGNNNRGEGREGRSSCIEKAGLKDRWRIAAACGLLLLLIASIASVAVGVALSGRSGTAKRAGESGSPTCDGASLIEVPDGGRTVSLEGSTFEAAAGADAGLCGAHGPMWYKVVGTGRRMSASTCSEATDFPTRLTLVGGGCSSAAGASCLGASAVDEDCSGRRRVINGNYSSSLIWESAEGATYWIAVGGRDAFSKGKYGLVLSATSRPVNNHCSKATPIAPPTPGTSFRLAGSSANSTEAGNCWSRYGEVRCRRSEAVWYQVAGTGNVLRASVCSDGGAFADVAAYDDCSIEPGKNPVAPIFDYSEDCKEGQGSSTEWLSLDRRQYWIAVGSYDEGSVENFNLTLSERIIPPNHNCTSAALLDLPPHSGTAFVGGSTINATDDVDFHVFRCTEELNYYSQVVWYGIVGTGSKLRISTCSNETDFLAQLFLLEGTCYLDRAGSLSGFTACQMGTRDAACESGEYSSSIEWIANEGVVYSLAVGNAAARGSFELHLSEASPLSRGNTECTYAYQIELPPPPLSNGSSSSILGTSDGTIENLAWYEITGTGRRMKASTCSNLTNFKTQLVLKRSCNSTTSLATSTEESNTCKLVGFHRDYASSLEWDSELDASYVIGVGSREANPGGTFELMISVVY